MTMKIKIKIKIFSSLMFKNRISSGGQQSTIVVYFKGLFINKIT